MTHLQYFEKLKNLEQVLKRNPALKVIDLAGKMEVSSRTVHRMLYDLRGLGTSISYSRKHRKYQFD